MSAVLPVHVFGHPADGMGLRQVADTWGLPLVEDAAEALGSWRGETHCGLFGAVGTLSFNGNKLITTGGGGALITNDAELAQRARHLSTTAKLYPWAFEHDAVGWNDRLPNLNAALGVAQLDDLSGVCRPSVCCSSVIWPLLPVSRRLSWWPSRPLVVATIGS